MEPNTNTAQTANRVDPLDEERPFFFIVVAVLAGLYLLAIYASPAVRAPERFIPFTLLMLLHIVLHWNSPSLVETRPRAVTYLVFQGALAFALPLIASSSQLVVGLFMTMIGESVGILRKPAAWAAAIVVILVLAPLDLTLLSDGSLMQTWMLVALPMTLFVVVYVTMYSRQGEARARAQALLAELESAHRQLSEYALRVEDLTIANERQRMARELHDTLAQGLAGLILQLEAADSHLASGNHERAQAILQQAMTRARATLADARSTICAPASRLSATSTPLSATKPGISPMPRPFRVR
ncbi:MAG: histidine kinase dimerization/phosphoacceptor domain-containing protein [Chloroflexi bacterium]|nr:histidine kinase dimerization/phosphoacceptor domain-containing protein [Chloroflexota bacterium]